MMQVGAVPIPVKVKEENGFMYEIDDLRNAITPKTKSYLDQFAFQSNRRCSQRGKPAPNFGSGKRAKPVCSYRRDLSRTDLGWGALYQYCQFSGVKERTVVVDGFSKKYAMTGFRLAWSAGAFRSHDCYDKASGKRTFFCE